MCSAARPGVIVVGSGRFGLTRQWVAHLLGMSTTKLGLEPLIGVEELAEYLGVPVQTIYD